MKTLKNGLRIITETVPDMHSVALGVWASVGTRDEEMRHNGVAHMTEHMLFKGTKTMNAQQIAERIENVGGHVNAYTSREITSYHIHLMKDDINMALGILADMYQNSVLPEEEIERERGVILQEIGMCHDTPDDLIFDNYYETAYQGQTFGAPILGREPIIANMQRGAIAGYIKNFYTPARTVISAAGNLDHDEFVQRVEDLFVNLPEDTQQEHPLAHYTGGEHRLDKELEQVHFVLGFEGVSRLDEDYSAAQVLSTMLGGGMSSRLFQEVREKRGLVYSVYSFHSASRDSGQFGIYAGTGPDKLPEVIPVICDEVLKVTSEIGEQELQRAKAQIKAGILMGRESMMTRADQQAKFLIYRGKPFDLQDLITRIDAVTVESAQEVARRIFVSKPTVAALGPLAELEEYGKITQRLVV